MERTADLADHLEELTAMESLLQLLELHKQFTCADMRPDQHFQRQRK